MSFEWADLYDNFTMRNLRILVPVTGFLRIPFTLNGDIEFAILFLNANYFLQHGDRKATATFVNEGILLQLEGFERRKRLL